MSQPADVPVHIRTAVGSDRSLLFSSWLGNYRASAWGRKFTTREFYPLQEVVIRHILTTSDVWIACNPEDPSQVFGWICAEPGVVHYIYVKQPYRRFGIATRLLHVAGASKDHPVVWTHETEAAVQYLSPYRRTYNRIRAYKEDDAA